ncbi:19989_t:CDS:2, partial [Gigaspora margarita]
WDDSELLELSLEGVQFYLFAFKIEKFLLYITSLEIVSNIDIIRASIRYMLFFIGKFNKKYALFVQKIEKDNCKLTQPSPILELQEKLQQHYLSQQVLSERELCAWRTLLKISSKTISKAQTYYNINGPGCLLYNKSTITRVHISEKSKKQFEKFFSDKNIVNLSSYKVDKYGLLLKYLKNQKETLWQKYFELYPNRIKELHF